jgi:ferritin
MKVESVDLYRREDEGIFWGEFGSFNFLRWFLREEIFEYSQKSKLLVQPSQLDLANPNSDIDSLS